MKREELLIMSLFTFLIVLAWTGFAIYHKSVTSTLTPDQQDLIQPIVASFDQKTIQDLKERTQETPAFTTDAVSAKSSSQSGTTTPVENIQPVQNLQQVQTVNLQNLNPNSLPGLSNSPITPSGLPTQSSSTGASLRGE